MTSLNLGLSLSNYLLDSHLPDFLHGALYFHGHFRHLSYVYEFADESSILPCAGHYNHDDNDNRPFSLEVADLLRPSALL